MKLRKFIFITIIVVASLMRLYELDEYPALNADEAAIGYNAYSLIQTGKDEHGNEWPVHFQSFNDYKPGLYFYTVVPSVYFFGLNELSVRVPAVVMGILTVILMYFVTDEIFLDKKMRHVFVTPGLVASAFLAVSPWHIHFSRGGWEVNVATFLITLGVWLYLVHKNRLWMLMISVISFALSLYTYHSARVIVPLLGLGLISLNFSDVKRNLKNYLLAGLLGLVALTPLMREFTKPDISSRAAGVGLFADTGPLERINEQRSEHKDFSGISVKLHHNKPINYGLAFLENWAEHFHGEFLFLSGDEIQRNRVPETGQMYVADLIFLLLGFVYLFGERKNIGKNGMIVVWWLVVAPTAAALTFQSPHSLRAHNMVIPLTMISALGFYKFLGWLGSRRKEISFGLVILLIGCVARYMHMYWVHMPKEYPFSSQYGLKELSEYIRDNEAKYEKIIVTDEYDQPYILMLFYMKYTPEKFQKEHQLTQRDSYGFSTVRSFGKYLFKPIEFDTDKPENPRSLMVGTDDEIPDEANVVEEIYGSNGYKYFQLVAN